MDIYINAFLELAVLPAIVIIVASYLIGSVNFSILLSRIIGKKDIRESGSGNAGATNMLRTYGKKMGVITLLLDVAKGIVCVLFAKMLVMEYLPNGTPDIWQTTDFFQMQLLAEKWLLPLPYIAGVAVILGHNFPLYFGFKGGKGVATSLGVVLMLDWKVGLIVAVIAIAIMAITRYVSLGSIVGGAMFIVIEIVKAIVMHEYNIIQLVCVIIIGGLLIARHHANIKRLLNGTENKLSFSKKEK